MIKCIVCGNEFKIITPSHLKQAHGITMSQYRERFPDALLYSEGRYDISRDVGVFERSSVPEEFGLMCLRRYSDPNDDRLLEAASSEKAIRVVRLQSWSKKSRLRIEQLFSHD